MSNDAPVGAFTRSVILDLIPAASIFLLIIFTTVPVNLVSTVHIGGLWPLVGIVYWTLARPQSMKMGLVFGLGILTDIITFVPFGIHASIFIIAHFILNKQRRFLMGQGFWVLWVAYAILALAVYSYLFVVTSVFLPGAISYVRGLAGVCMAWACVPIAVWCLSRLNDMIDLFDEPIS
jgi:rod shape-determining protein MreD